MQEVARKLDLTATEASRQLQRLSEAGLIERSPDSAYSTTQFGKLILTLSTSMEFAYKNRPFFSDHCVWQLPSPFILRLGELSECHLVTDLNEAIVRWEELVKATEDHVWSMTPQVMPLLSRATSQKLAQGLKVKSLVSENLSEISKANVTKGPNVERRYLANIPAIILSTDKAASFSLPLFDGNMHHASFFASDKNALEWINDLFLHYWEKAKKYL